MPPKRCPECGRFLSNELVASLAVATVPCPRCETPLEAGTLIGGSRPSRRAQREQAAEARATTAAAVDPGLADRDGDDREAAPSIRPPDLDPSQVRAPGDDVLTGWDVGATAAEVESWRADHRPFPVDAVVVAGAALGGGVLGAAVTDRHRALGAAVGVVVGGVAAGAARRVWELEG